MSAHTIFTLLSLVRWFFIIGATAGYMIAGYAIYKIVKFLKGIN